MNEQDKACARACLNQITFGMSELREISTWWDGLAEDRRQEFKDFAASVNAYHRSLTE